jgi:hypothetical protein
MLKLQLPAGRRCACLLHSVNTCIMYVSMYLTDHARFAITFEKLPKSTDGATCTCTNRPPTALTGNRVGVSGYISLLPDK